MTPSTILHCRSTMTSSTIYWFLLRLMTVGTVFRPVMSYHTGEISASLGYLNQHQNDCDKYNEDTGQVQLHSRSHAHHHHQHHHSHNQNYNSGYFRPQGENHQSHHNHHQPHHSHHHHNHHHNSNEHFNAHQDYRQDQFPQSPSTEEYLRNPEDNSEGQQHDGPYYNSNSFTNTNKYGQNQNHEHVGNCRLPDSWKGRWFQSGIPGPIFIDSKFIESKGTCYESSGDKYLFVEKKTCYRCLVINVRHHNVLEYKESSFCEEKDSLENLCLQIPGDAQLYSLFRMDAQPIDCPFKGPFLFSYNRGHGVCKSPMSNVDICTEPSKLLLRYQACPDVPRTESTTEELQCLAEWRDSTYHYLVGKLNYKLAASNEDRYRCFIYEISKGHLIKIAESGDATCIGLSSPAEGARTLTFHKGTNNASVHETSTKCKFPSWVTMHHWLSLDGKLIVRTNHKNSSISVTTSKDANKQEKHQSQFSSIHGAHTGAYAGTSFGSAPNIQDINHKYLTDGARIQCQSRVDISEEHVAIIAHHTVGCTSKTLCMHLFRRDTHVIEVQMREKGKSHSDDYECGKPEAMTPNLPFATLITSGENSMRCPYLGKYMTTTIMRNGHLISSLPNGHPCISHHHSQSAHSVSGGGESSFHHHQGSFHSLVVGCGHRATMDFHSKCLPHEPITSYECMGSWEENGIGFLIASPMSRSSGSALRYCFSYSETDEGLQVYSSKDSCLRDGSPNLEGIWAFNLTVDGQCAEPVTTDGSGGAVRVNHYNFNVIVILHFVSKVAARLMLHTHLPSESFLMSFPITFLNNPVS